MLVRAVHPARAGNFGDADTPASAGLMLRRAGVDALDARRVGANAGSLRVRGAVAVVVACSSATFSLPAAAASFIGPARRVSATPDDPPLRRVSLVADAPPTFPRVAPLAGRHSLFPRAAPAADAPSSFPRVAPAADTTSSSPQVESSMGTASEALPALAPRRRDASRNADHPRKPVLQSVPPRQFLLPSRVGGHPTPDGGPWALLRGGGGRDDPGGGGGRGRWRPLTHEVDQRHVIVRPISGGLRPADP